MEFRSIAFPVMFSHAKTNVVTNSDATLSNINLLLQSCKNSLIGDPYFGASLRRFIHQPNNVVLYDLIVDEVYVAIKTFIPQLHITRKDIKLHSSGTSLYATINCINKLDNQPSMYDIQLLTE